MERDFANQPLKQRLQKEKKDHIRDSVIRKKSLLKLH